jgi:hypothetical protein
MPSMMTVPFTKAFEAWENEFRNDPSKFMTSEEAAALEVLPLSERRAAYFEAILNTLSAGNGWAGIGSPPAASK